MVTIQYQVVARNGQVAVREKSFKSEDAMARWIERQEENGAVVDVLRYSYEEGR